MNKIFRFDIVRRFFNWWLCEGNPQKYWYSIGDLTTGASLPIWIRFNATGNCSRMTPVGFQDINISPDDPVNDRESL